MAEPTVKEKTKRAKRRNYERELEALRLQCEVSIETLKSLVGSVESPNTRLGMEGQQTAYERILAKISRENGK